MRGFDQIQFRWLSSLPLILVTCALIVIAVNTLVGAQSANAPMREALFDYYQRLKPAPATVSSPFHIVTIDPESMEKIGPWPWPRTILAELVEKSIEAGSKGILIAEPLDVPDPLSPETIGDFWLKGAQDDALASQLKLLPRTDEVLAQALSNIPAAVGFAENSYTTLQELNFQRSDIAKNPNVKKYDQRQGDYFALPTTAESAPLSPTIKAASSPVVLDLPADENGTVRRSHLFWAIDGKPIPSLAMEAARLAIEAPHASINLPKKLTTAQGPRPEYITLNETELALTSGATLRHYPQRRSNITQTSAWKLLDGSASKQPFKNSVILIGRSQIPGYSIKTTKGRISPVALQANIADQITNGVSLKRPLWIGYIEAIAVMLLGAGAIMVAQRLMFWQAIGFAFAGALCLVAISAFLFIGKGYLINPLLPAMAMFVGVFSIAGGKSVSTVLFDDNIRSAFKGMLPETTMKALRDDRSRKLLNGVNRKITILACELRIMDNDLEDLEQTPEYVSQIIATASHNLRKTIVNIGGTVDQAEGGRIFAYFNAPLETADHIEKACAGALAMVESMDKTNTELAASAHTRNVQVHLGIGIATGTCFAGPMGHGHGNRYSAIGPAVNLASFLCRQSEYYGPAIICDDAVHRESHHKYAFLELDRIKSSSTLSTTATSEQADKPVHIHALIGNPFIKSSKSYRALDKNHRAMISAYRAGNMPQALEELETIKKFPAARIALFDIYEERIKELDKNGVPENWDGIHPTLL